MYNITTTFNKEFDTLLQEALTKYSKGEMTDKQVIELLAYGESYDDNNEPRFPDIDMVKETKYDVIETMSTISGKDEDDLWSVYDEVYAYVLMPYESDTRLFSNVF
jgi:hypothetical protein